MTCLVSIALYLGIRHSLYHEVDSFLAGEVMEFRAILSAAHGNLDDVQRRIRAELGSRHRGDLTFRLLDTDGRVLLTSAPSNGLPDPWPTPSPPRGGILFRTESGSELATHTRTGSQWVAVDGYTHIVQATYLLDQVNSSLTRFVQICAAALAVAAVFAVIGGRMLATRSLRPVGRMVSAAREISMANLEQRLDRTGNGDELDVLAATFNEMFERLEKQVRKLRQFTADAAHELRTPLAALRGNSELALLQHRPVEEMRVVLADSIEEYDRLARIADDLLLLARADADQDIVRRAPLRLDAAVADVIDLFSPIAEERGVELKFDAAPEVWIDGDDGRMRQMIGNVLDNAIKYTPAGGQVGVELVAHAGSVDLTFRDTGAGVPAEHVPHVFERFYRADPARTPQRGAGLGLAISRAIVEAHNGTIQLSSTPSFGTTVRVRLPVRETVHSR